MIEYVLDNLGPWSWIILGLVLMGLELLAPGVFLMWLGLAAVLTGLVDWAFGLSWQAATLLFAVLSVVTMLVGRAVSRHPDEEETGRPSLNRRGHGLVGRVFMLDAPIAGGEGRIRVDDSVWRIIGPDVPAGASVRVVRVDGATLVVESA
ncbi:MAG TPA: NfeD family protein [Beijerinckiaceae bacterium]|nr:NfeD family protein [Beijerinckiaceae bacterium]